jgi:hypothetical protein
MHRVLTWPRVWTALIGSLIGLLLSGSVPAIRDTRVGGLLLDMFATFWIVSLVLLFPIRVFFDRREFPAPRAESEASWPGPLRWLGSRWLEALLWGLVVVMALMLAVPLIIWAVEYVLRKIAP